MNDNEPKESKFIKALSMAISNNGAPEYFASRVTFGIDMDNFNLDILTLEDIKQCSIKIPMREMITLIVHWKYAVDEYAKVFQTKDSTSLKTSYEEFTQNIRPYFENLSKKE